jgi:hypothetical protein
MQVTFPRLFGVLVLFWAIFVASTPPGPETPWWFWPMVGVVSCVPAVLLLRVRHVRAAAVAVVLLTAAGFLRGRGGDDFLFWMAVLVAASEGHPRERALLLRVMLSTVYGFAVLSKLNPAWLAGDQTLDLVQTQAQLAPLLPLVTSSLGPALAWAVLAIEAWLAIGRWFQRTRLPTAVGGVLTHVVLIIAATEGLDSFLLLLPLNLGLVAMYLAFWHPVLKEPPPKEISSEGHDRRLQAYAMR